MGRKGHLGVHPPAQVSGGCFRVVCVPCKLLSMGGPSYPIFLFYATRCQSNMGLRCALDRCAAQFEWSNSAGGWDGGGGDCDNSAAAGARVGIRLLAAWLLPRSTLLLTWWPGLVFIELAVCTAMSRSCRWRGQRRRWWRPRQQWPLMLGVGVCCCCCHGQRCCCR